MAKYFVKTPAYVEDRYIPASPQNPLVVEFKDETAPSRAWEPLDKAAREALLKLAALDAAKLPEDERKAFFAKADVKYRVLSPVDVAQRKHEAEEASTMSDLRKAQQGKVVGAE